MSNDRTCNGWSNYETWLVNLWWDNDGHCEQFNDYARECIQAALEESDIENDDLNGIKQNAAHTLSDMLEEYLDDSSEEFIGNNCGLFTDLIRSAIGEVNFYEIAQHYIYNNWEEVYSDYRADLEVEVEE